MAKKKKDRAAGRRPIEPASKPLPKPVAAPTPAPPADSTPPPAPTSTIRPATSSLLLVAALALAAGLRAAHLRALSGAAFVDQLQIDQKYYDEWAQRIAGGEWVGDRLFFVDPLYAYFLALLYSIIGRDLFAVRLIQLALGVGTCALVGELGRRVLRSPAAGALAALLYAAFVPAVFYEAGVEKTALGVFLLTAALVLYFGRAPLALFASGSLLGLAALTRGNLLLLAPLGAIGVLLLPAETEGASAQTTPGRKNLSPRAPHARENTGRDRKLRAVLFLAGVVEIVGLVTFRNFLVSGELVLTTVNAGQNFYIGHFAGQEFGTYQTVDVARPDPRYEEDDFRAEAEKRTGRTMRATEVSDFWFSEGLRQMRANPGKELWLTWRKVLLFFHDYEIPDTEDMGVIGHFSPVLRLPVLRMSLLTPLALLGAVALWSNRRARALVVVVLVYCAGVVAFFVLSRIRVQIVPILAVLAGGGLVWLAQTVARGDARRLATAAVLLAVAGFGATWRPPWMADHERKALAVSWQNAAGQAERAGQPDLGIAAYEMALSISAPDILFSARRLGHLYLERREYEKAERNMLLVLEHKPQSRSGREALVTLYETMWNDPRVPRDDVLRRKLADAYRGVGRAADADRVAAGGEAAVAVPGADPAAPLYAESRELRRQGRWAEAIAKLREAVRIGRYDEDARYLLGSLMEQHAPPREMEEYWRNQAGRDAKPQTSLYFWAVALERQGDLEAAYRKLGEALEVDPAHEMSENRRGLIRERQGRLEDALAHYRTAAEILPGFRPPLENAARVLERLGRSEEARAVRERISHPPSDTPSRYVSWARWLLKKGRKEAALAELQRALAENPDDAAAKELLAQLGD